jgi:hypothetical protein
LQSQWVATVDLTFKQCFPIDPAGGDVFDASAAPASIVERRTMSVLAVAAQFGALKCVRFLLMIGEKAGASEVKAAFRGGQAGSMQLLWGAFPHANLLELTLEAVKT